MRLTTVEILSGFAIKVRTGALEAADFHRLRGLFLADVKRRTFRPIRAMNHDYQLAAELITKHGMTRQVRTLDALQLAVAMRIHPAASLDLFVCADQRLCEIARLEGFVVLNPELH